MCGVVGGGGLWGGGGGVCTGVCVCLGEGDKSLTQNLNPLIGSVVTVELFSYRFEYSIWKACHFGASPL